MKTAAPALHLELCLDLRAGAVHQCEPYAERGEQIEINGEFDEAAVDHQFAAERDDEGLAAECVNIGRYRLKPVDEAVLRR